MMLRDAAIHWVRTNCPNRKLSWDVKEALDAAAAAGANCWFVFGSGMTRSKAPFLLHCFAGEVFIFQLTGAQAAAMGVNPNVMGCGRDRRPDSIPPALPPVVSLERFDVGDARLTQTTPIVGRLQYEVRAGGVESYCVRLDYDLPDGRRIAWYCPLGPLDCKGTIDVQFLPVSPSSDVATAYTGPLVLFARLFEMSPPELTDSRRPISTVCAALVDLI